MDCWALERTLGGNRKVAAAGGTRRERSATCTAATSCKATTRLGAAPARAAAHERGGPARTERAGALDRGAVEMAAQFYELGLKVDDLVEDFYAGLIGCHTHNGQASLAVTTIANASACLPIAWA